MADLVDGAILIVPLLAIGAAGGDDVESRVFGSLLFFVYETAAVAAWGRTPGKALLGMMIRRVDGTPVGLLESVVRAAPLLLLADETAQLVLLALVTPVSVGLTPRTLYELASRTVVVDETRPSPAPDKGRLQWIGAHVVVVLLLAFALVASSRINDAPGDRKFVLKAESFWMRSVPASVEGGVATSVGREFSAAVAGVCVDAAGHGESDDVLSIVESADLNVIDSAARSYLFPSSPVPYDSIATAGDEVVALFALAVGCPAELERFASPSEVKAFQQIVSRP